MNVQQINCDVSKSGRQSADNRCDDLYNVVSDFCVLSPKAQIIACGLSKELKLILKTFGAEFSESNLSTFKGVPRTLNELFGN
uniref:Ferredoxin--NADP(+) reductase n=1 Tax=Mesocestoides corti TaxID=53468 RepID=A0A5K3FHH4_MESCO